jgi:hypothetical protein
MDRTGHTAMFALCVIALTATTAQGVDAPAPPQPYTGGPASNAVATGTLASPERPVVSRTSVPPFAAIVGAVRTPGAYELPVTALTIADLIDRAGGLVDAGAIVRVDRGIRSQLISRTFIDSEIVAAGDVIVISPAMIQTSQSGTADVVVVGLYDVPVVVQTSGEITRLSTLLQRLNQSPELLESAQTRPVDGHKLGGDATLASATVVMLDRRLVRAVAPEVEQRLIRPPHLLSEVSAVATPVSTFEDQRRWEHSAVSSLLDSEELPNLDPPSTEAITFDPLPPEPVVEEEPTQQVAMLTESTVAPAPPVLTMDLPKPRVESLPPVKTADPPAVERKLRAAEKATVVPARVPSVSKSATSSPSSTGAAFLFLPACLVLGFAGIALMTSWVVMYSRLRASRAAQQAAATVPFGQVISDLVHNRLPIDEEPVELPARRPLHGRAVGESRLVLDAPQPLAGPHFSATSRSRSAEPVAKQAPEIPRESIGEGGGKAPEAPSRRVAGSTDGGLLERVLLAMDREGRR